MKKYVIGIVICIMFLLMTEFMDPSIEPYIATLVTTILLVVFSLIGIKSENEKVITYSMYGAIVSAILLIICLTLILSYDK